METKQTNLLLHVDIRRFVFQFSSKSLIKAKMKVMRMIPGGPWFLPTHLFPVMTLICLLALILLMFTFDALI